MAVALDATGTKLTTSTTVSSVNYTGITVGSGSNRGLVCVLCLDDIRATSPVATWNGTSMTLLQYKVATAGGAVAIFGLANPASGNNTLAVSWSSQTSRNVIDAISFTGVDQTGGTTSFPHSAVAGTTSTNPTITITSATGNAVVACFSTNSSAFTAINNTQLFIDTSLPSTNNAANWAAGASSVAMTGTATSGAWAAAGTDVLAAASALITGWQNTDGETFKRRLLLDQQPPAFVSNFQTTSTITGNAWFTLADRPVYGKPLKDSIAPAFTEPKAVTVGISGNAWYEPFDIPVYGKPSRDFVAPAFTEPNAVTVAISGMSWFEPLDIPVYGKPLKDFVAPAFTEPVTVTVGISGMAWYEPYDQPFYGKKLRDDTSPAFTEPVTPSVGISGNAWFEPWDIPVYGKPLRDFLTPSFTSQFVIAGISGNAWFVREDTYKRKPAPVDDPPSRAIQFTNQTVGISGMAWYHPLDFAKSKVVNYTYPPTYTPFDQIINWGYITSDSLVLPDKMFPNAPSWDPRVVVQNVVGISGMSWFEPWDIPVYGKKLKDLVPAAFSLPVQKTLIGSFNVSDTTFLPDPPISFPIALEQPIVQQTVGISGMAWFEPFDVPIYGRKGTTQPPSIPPPPPPTVKASFNVSDTIFLPDAPLSPAFAWDPRAFVPISGMSWFEPLDFAKGRVVTYTHPPAHLDVQIYPQATASFNVSDTIFLPDPPLFIPPNFFLPTPTIFWNLTSDDTVVLPDPLLTIASAWDPKFTFQQTVGISGMAWFEPPDFAKGLVINYTPPAAWDPQFVFQIPSAGYEPIVKFIGNVGHFMIR